MSVTSVSVPSPTQGNGLPSSLGLAVSPASFLQVVRITDVRGRLGQREPSEAPSCSESFEPLETAREVGVGGPRPQTESLQPTGNASEVGRSSGRLPGASPSAGGRAAPRAFSGGEVASVSIHGAISPHILGGPVFKMKVLGLKAAGGAPGRRPALRAPPRSFCRTSLPVGDPPPPKVTPTPRTTACITAFRHALLSVHGALTLCLSQERPELPVCTRHGRAVGPGSSLVSVVPSTSRFL